MGNANYERAVGMYHAALRADGTISDWRTGFDRLFEAFDIPAEAVIEPVDCDGVPGLQVSMPGASPDKVVIHFHSGGYVMGSSAAYREFACRYSVATGATVIVPDYRLAPENPFPAAADDGLTVFNWCAQRWGAANIVLSGDSAGGGLCVSTLLTLRDAGRPLPAAAVAISPLFDMAAEGSSYATNAAVDPLIARDLIINISKLYIGEIDPHDEARASPLWGKHHELPPLFLTASNTEVLRDDCVRLAASIKAAGGTVESRYPEETLHTWTMFPFLDEAKSSMAEIGAFVRRYI